MTTIQTIGGLVELGEALYPGWAPTVAYGRSPWASGWYSDYQAIYRTQVNVRTAISFLAEGIAGLGLHVFRRISDTDRERLGDHALAALFDRPNPFTTRHRLIEALVSDMCIFDNAYW